MQITTIGLDLAKNVFQVRRHDLYLMPHRDKFSGPKMGCAARFHSDEAGREPRGVSSIPTWRPCLASRAPLSTGRLRLRRPCWRRAQVAIRHRGIQDRATRPPGEALPGCRDCEGRFARRHLVVATRRCPPLGELDVNFLRAIRPHIREAAQRRKTPRADPFSLVACARLQEAEGPPVGAPRHRRERRASGGGQGLRPQPDAFS